MLTTSAGLPVLGGPGISLCSNSLFRRTKKHKECNPSCFLEVTEDRDLVGFIKLDVSSKYKLIREKETFLLLRLFLVVSQVFLLTMVTAVFRAKTQNLEVTSSKTNHCIRHAISLHKIELKIHGVLDAKVFMDLFIQKFRNTLNIYIHNSFLQIHYKLPRLNNGEHFCANTEVTSFPSFSSKKSFDLYQTMQSHARPFTALGL